MGDFNAHNTRWGPQFKPTTTAGRNLATDIDKLSQSQSPSQPQNPHIPIEKSNTNSKENVPVRSRQSTTDIPPYGATRVHHDRPRPPDGTNIKIVSWNTHGARLKIAEIIHTVLNDNIHILLLQETNIPIRSPHSVDFVHFL